jgi:4'-phosphopantetheinyl transferase EntD
VPINSQFSHALEAPNPAALSAALAALFPPGVIAAELRGPGEAALLHPEEARSVAKAVPKRVGEFAAGRLCARRALTELGISNFALTMAPDRAPVWPDPIVGSITHTRGFCAAVIAERRRFAALGLDVEVAGDVKRELWPHICVPRELVWLDSLPPDDRAAAATLVFSAKEAFYKCQYPLTGERLSFADVWVSVGAASLVISPARRLNLSPGVDGEFRGSYRIEDGYVSAAFWVTDPTTPAPTRAGAARG